MADLKNLSEEEKTKLVVDLTKVINAPQFKNSKKRADAIKVLEILSRTKTQKKKFNFSMGNKPENKTAE